MTDTDDIDLTPAESLLFWFIWALACFATGGFIAGVLYPYY